MNGKSAGNVQTSIYRMKKNSSFILVAAVFAIIYCGTGSGVAAATITLNASDSFNISSWTGGTNWSDGKAPVAANDYVVASDRILRSSYSTVGADISFGGHSLTLGDGSTGGTLAVVGSGSVGYKVTVNNLILNKGIVTSYLSSTTSPTSLFTLSGAIQLGSGGGSFSAGAGGSDYRSFTVDASIGGTGGLIVTGINNKTGYYSTVTLNTANSYSGGTYVTNSASGGYTVLALYADGAAGTGNVTVGVGGKLYLANGLTHNYIDDSANLVLQLGLSAGSVELNFSGADILSGLSLDGGTNFLSAGNYDASTLNNLYGSAMFSGDGILSVVPEPSVMNLTILGTVFFLFWKKGKIAGMVSKNKGVRAT